MRVSVASGKGGTGKTIVSTSLVWILADRGRRVTYVDADVEEPNGHLFLHPQITDSHRFRVSVPRLISGSCSGCGECQVNCAFNAIVALSDRVMVFPELCHSCGVCNLVCRERALTEVPRGIGTIENGVVVATRPMTFRSATLDVGEARATPLIAGLLHGTAQNDLVLVDAPPGTSCSAMEAVRGSDLVLLVTEPTPFGLHDLQIAVDMCRALGRAMTAVINRCDLGDERVARFLEGEGIPVLARIPFLSDVATAYAHGRVAAAEKDEFRRPLEAIATSLLVRGAA